MGREALIGEGKNEKKKRLRGGEKQRWKKQRVRISSGRKWK